MTGLLQSKNYGLWNIVTEESGNKNGVLATQQMQFYILLFMIILVVVNYYTLNLYYSTTYYIVQGAVHISHPKIFFKKLAAYFPMYYSSMWYFLI